MRVIRTTRQRWSFDNYLSGVSLETVANSPVDSFSHQFAMEQTRREVSNCTDIDAMRKLTLDVITLMERQRAWFIQELLSNGRDPLS